MPINWGKLRDVVAEAAGTVVERANDIAASETAKDLLQKGREAVAKAGGLAVEARDIVVETTNAALQSKTARGLKHQAGELLEDAQKGASSAIEAGKKKIQDLGGPTL